MEVLESRGNRAVEECVEQVVASTLDSATREALARNR